ncbi:hypothetical protein QQ045_015169 [Rhodiola kirilowii]
MKEEELVLFCYAVRAVWYNRNKCYHEGHGLQVEEVGISTKALARSHFRPGFSFTITDLDGSSEWIPPQKPFLKLNCDGSWDEDKRLAGISGVCRDEEGTIIGVLTDLCPGVDSILEAECRAILMSMRWALKQGLSYCIFETDCTEAFASITLRRYGPSNIPVCVQEILRLMIDRKHWRLSLVRREANSFADKLARLAREKVWRWSNAEALPRLPGVFP